MAELPAASQRDHSSACGPTCPGKLSKVKMIFFVDLSFIELLFQIHFFTDYKHDFGGPCLQFCYRMVVDDRQREA